MYERNDTVISIRPEFSILAETDDWIAVDKAAPLLTHPTRDKDEPTLWHGLKELLRYELTIGGQISIITRLDRETSGITLIAKHTTAASAMGKLMQAGGFHKKYLALILDIPSWDELSIEAPILRKGDISPSPIFIKQCVHPKGKPCQTDVRVLGHAHLFKRDISLVECRPLTGRMHQIRVHLAHVGHPIVGDKIYGSSEECYLEHIRTGWTPSLEEKLHIPRHALHATELCFTDPLTHKEHIIRSPLPDDLFPDSFKLIG